MDDDATASRLAYVANSVDQSAVPVISTLRWRVARAGPWRLLEQGDRVADFDRFDDLLYVLYQRVYGRLMEHLALGGWLGLHGGLVTVAGQRVAILGDKGAGKTTLMLRLLLDGHDVEGDELILTRRGLAVALPRRFHVKPGTAELLPEVSAALAASPRTALDDATPIIGLDPADLGRPTATRPAPVDAAVVLRAAHRRPASVRAVPTVDLLARLLDHTHPTSESRSQLLATVVALLGQARGFEADAGPLDDTAAQLVAALDG